MEPVVPPLHPVGGLRLIVTRLRWTKPDVRASPAPMTSTRPLFRQTAAEFVGTALLVAIVVGSGIMAERLAAGAQAVALWANTAATMSGLVALIAALGPVSGAHFNPVVTIVEFLLSRRSARETIAYVGAQIAGGMGGTLLAHAMFDLPLLQSGSHVRAGAPQLFSEAVATAGLLLVIRGVSATRSAFVPVAVAAWIGAAYWFTASTSFANPAVTLARAFTNTFSGIRLVDVPGFVLGQTVGALVAVILCRVLFQEDVNLERQ